MVCFFGERFGVKTKICIHLIVSVGYYHICGQLSHIATITIMQMGTNPSIGLIPDLLPKRKVGLRPTRHVAVYITGRFIKQCIPLPAGFLQP